MTGNGSDDVRRTLEAWREQGHDRLDPVRFHLMEALARRADGYAGDARRVLDARLAGLAASYARDLGLLDRQETAPAEGPGEAAGLRSASVRGALGALLDDLGDRRQPAAEPGVQTASSRDHSAASSYPELVWLDFFRDTWSRLGTRRQLRQSLERVPENAGPLNSSLLVHRMLSLMGQASPEYLHQFLSYIDALSWMEQAMSGGGGAEKDAARSTTGKKGGRRAAR